MDLPVLRDWCNRVLVWFVRPPTPYFSWISAYCFSMPSRMTWAFVFPVLLQTAINFFSVSASYLNFNSRSFGVVVKRVPFFIPKQSTSLSLRVQSNYNVPTKKSQGGILQTQQKTFWPQLDTQQPERLSALWRYHCLCAAPLSLVVDALFQFKKFDLLHNFLP